MNFDLEDNVARQLFDNTNKTVWCIKRNIHVGKDFDCLGAHTNVISSMFANKNSLV